METKGKAIRLTSAFCCLVLAACGGGGGGGAPATSASTGNTSTPPSGNANTSASSPAPVPDVSISAPLHPTASGFLAAGYDFKTNLPRAGAPFPLAGADVKVTATSISDANLQGDNSVAMAPVATFIGTETKNGKVVPVFNLKIPSLSLSVDNVHGDGTLVTLADGSIFSLGVETLTYTALGAWTYKPAGGTETYLGQTATGFLSPAASIPTSGSAAYQGSGTTGGAVGVFAVPAGDGTIQAGTLAGDATLNVNFANDTFTGTLSNMTATTTTTASPVATPWNTVTMGGNLSRGSANVSFGGTTATSVAPTGAGNAGFSYTATGRLVGQFYGPNAEEVGATWTLSEPNATNGKAAFGTFAATRH